MRHEGNGDAVSGYQGRGLHGQVVEEIGIRIVGGSYELGTHLLTDQLEQEFDVSKTVVREALKVLAAKGLVESRQNRGTTVRPRRAWSLLDGDVLRWQGIGTPDFAFLEDLAEIRSIIEPAAARLAAIRRTDADLQLMREALEEMVAAGQDPDAVGAADIKFHRAVLDSAHNELLSCMEVVLVGGLQIRDHFVHHAKNLADAAPMHQALCDAIGDGADLRARTAMEELLAQAGSDLADAHRQAERAAAAQAAQVAQARAGKRTAS